MLSCVSLTDCMKWHVALFSVNHLEILFTVPKWDTTCMSNNMAFSNIDIKSMGKQTEKNIKEKKKKQRKIMYVPVQMQFSSFPWDQYWKQAWTRAKEKKITGKMIHHILLWDHRCCSSQNFTNIPRYSQVFPGKQVQTLYANIIADTLQCP